MKKIIVTGYNGFIGSLLVSLLKEKGYKVVGIDTGFYGSECTLFNFKHDIIEIKKDIRNIKEEDLEGAYAVCHLAALSNDPVGELAPKITYDINYRASLRLAKLSEKVGVEKFIYSSSCSMYGIAGSEYLAEEVEFSPITAYAKSKVMSEKDIMPLTDENFSVTFLRNATAYGISPKLRLDLVVNNLIGWAMTTGQIKILSDGTPWRPLIHAEDIARAFIAVIEAPNDWVSGQAFNVGITSENYQIKDIAYLIKDAMGKCDVVITGEHEEDARTYKVDFSKIFNTLPNFRPKWRLKSGIEQICQYYDKYSLNSEKFNGRYFVRLRQLKYLIENNKIDENLFWI
ncbi:MAG: NAD-dependent epimerase/dehydratase family protein [Candidatus Hodarchaeota archaeon]